MLKKANIAVLVSGGGTNLEALLKAQEAGEIPHGEIVLVASNVPDAYALKRAANHGVPGVAIPAHGDSHSVDEAALIQVLDEYQVDLVILGMGLAVSAVILVVRRRQIAEHIRSEWMDRRVLKCFFTSAGVIAMAVLMIVNILTVMP